MSMFAEKAFLGIGGPAAGAGIASAIATLVVPAVPFAVPLIGALATIVGLKLSGALDNPDKVLIEPERADARRWDVPN